MVDFENTIQNKHFSYTYSTVNYLCPQKKQSKRFYTHQRWSTIVLNIVDSSTFPSTISYIYEFDINRKDISTFLSKNPQNIKYIIYENIYLLIQILIFLIFTEISSIFSSRHQHQLLKSRRQYGFKTSNLIQIIIKLKI